ncbi:hypothetical protein [Cloacibacillus evryensis]|uniref:hypothetical protein n=1 Tax=Cloacibacillus evryensis TaxID=508460 RepID=UPI002B216739|nr:hypothetical protein [Cloacibacillus evryensis]MEA5034199.1 hypothetical protein [Cloacibacillus evryensis]
MRKGAHLEREIDRVIKFLDTRGIHGHKNHAKRTQDGTYIEGEPFDYEIFSPSRVWCFDAKECEASAWPLSKAKLSQVSNLLKVNGFFLVWFSGPKKLIAFDAKIIQAKLGLQGSITPDEGTEFDWQTFLK